MKYLTVDFGSTYTKLTALDSSNSCIVGTASAHTTIKTDVMEGFRRALTNLEGIVGEFKYDKLLCCSSAAGGLKMVALGLVPELTAKAAKLAAASAGAKVVKTYAYEISKSEQEEIYKINPDLILLCGGTDGGNKEVITANAKRLCAIDRNFSVIIAGNKSASHELEEIFNQSNKNYLLTENVMPSFNQLNVEPAKTSIKDLFIRNIIEAKGLSQIQKIADLEIVPTPLAVMKACELFSKGTKNTKGIGELLAIDVGGATTDIYSMAKGIPILSNIVQKGLPEPFSKRTVEGDLGMRYSLNSLKEELEIESFAESLNVTVQEIENWVNECVQNPSCIAKAESTEFKIDQGLARCAVEIASDRHCGILESTYTPMGEIFSINGKDLSEIPYIIGIGGVIINSDKPVNILKGAIFNPAKHKYMKPKKTQYLLDRKYIFASMGLLSMIDSECALRILQKEIKIIQ